MLNFVLAEKMCLSVRGKNSATVGVWIQCLLLGNKKRNYFWLYGELSRKWPNHCKMIMREGMAGVIRHIPTLSESTCSKAQGKKSCSSMTRENHRILEVLYHELSQAGWGASQRCLAPLQPWDLTFISSTADLGSILAWIVDVTRIV